MGNFNKWSFVTLLLVFAMSLLELCYAEEPPDLFTDVDNGRESTNYDAIIVRTRYVKINLKLLAKPNSAVKSLSSVYKVIGLNLFDNVYLVAVLERIEESYDQTGLIWTGRIKDDPNSKVILVVTDNVVTGNIRVPGEKFYQIRYVGDGVHAVHQIDESKFPPEHPPIIIDVPQDN